MGNTLLTPDERARLVYLIDLLNDLTVTQLDTDEINEYNALLAKLGEP